MRIAAVNIMLDPSAEVKGAATLEREGGFGEGVPQPEDYIRIWEATRSVTSGRCVTRNRENRDFCHNPDEKTTRPLSRSGN